MSEKKNVLVFPCGSEIGLELHRSLGLSIHYNLIGGSSVDDHGKYIFDQYVDDIPFVNDDAFTEKLNAIIDAHEVDFIFPAHDSVVLRLAQEKAAGNLHCDVITSPAETCEIARSKGASYRKFEGLIPTPKVYDAAALQPEDFPVFLKPDVGQGSKGTYLAKTAGDVKFYVEKDPTLLALEYLPGKEYTIDCFTDRHGKLRFCEGRERARTNNGISVNSSAVDDERFVKFGEIINSTLRFRGVWFFQLKEKDGEMVLMEIAPRVAGTMGLARCKGVNLALLSLFDAQDMEIEVFENNCSMTIDRALENRYKHDISYRHVYLDFDDLVVFEDKVNPAVMAFVYQCLNQGKKVHLLTRHAGDLHAALGRYHLDGVFDDVVWIQDGSPKADHITESEAIFIDDSFAERLAVHKGRSIPTFDGHMLESLMEKF